MMSGQVSQAALAGWQDLLPDCGVRRPHFINGVDLAAPIVLGDSRKIQLADFVEFLESQGRVIKRSDFFWRAGEVYDFSFLGPVGEAVLSSKTLGGALSRFAAYFSLLQDASELNFETNGGAYASVNYRILDPEIWPRSSDACFTLGIIAQIIKKTVNDSWRHTDIIFETDRPGWGHDISDYLKTNCGYGGAANMIRFPAAWLSLPINAEGAADNTEPDLKAALLRQRRASYVRDRACYHIFKNIGVAEFSQTAVARAMGMSRRTLRRRLADEGLNFQAVLDECRMEAAVLEMRRRPEASLAEIALRLGYTEHSSFTRAFSRWSGCSPAGFRRDLAAPAPDPARLV
ncbi:MAG: AraC-like transcriptional regulator QhpR [Rhodospirillales bacterium]